VVRFPQIIEAPFVVTLLWSKLFEKFAALDPRTAGCLSRSIFASPAEKVRQPKRSLAAAHTINRKRQRNSKVVSGAFPPRDNV
jgi:hypothetical protein